MESFFSAKHGMALAGFIFVTLVVGFAFCFLLSLTPPRLRKPLIAGVTFLAGLFFAVEFFLPVNADGKNFLTPAFKPVSAATTILQSFAIGLGIYSLVGIHLRNVAQKRTGWGFSLLLLGGILAMAIPALLQSYYPKNAVYKGAYNIVFQGVYNSLGPTMFSIVAFYIVSAAYRAFRVRSIESTILLVAAFVVMLGQVALGQALTAGIPKTGLVSNLRLEAMADWVLKKVNSPATLAVDLGLGVGALATSLRLWLSLERGSYFDQEL